MSITTDKPTTSFTPELAIVDGKITTTSQQIAEHFGKRHADVIRAIRNLDLPTEFSQRNFAQTPAIDPQNGQTYNAYTITRDGFALLAMGFTGKEAMHWKLAYIAAFNAMEKSLETPAFSIMNRRLLVSFSNGKEQVQVVPNNACVAAPEEWAKMIREAGGLFLEPQTLADIATACTERLARQSASYMQSTKELRLKLQSH